MQALVQSTRLYVYNIVDALMDAFRDHLKKMGGQFLSGYATLASGEKDPRNLLIAFKITRVILIDFDISKHIEVGTRLESDRPRKTDQHMRARTILTLPFATIPSLFVHPQMTRTELALMISKIRSGALIFSLFCSICVYL